MSFPVQRVTANQHGRDFVVGDVHGCFSKLSAELDGLQFNPDIDRLFSVGDMVDRGPESVDVTDWLDRPWFYAVRGNHEQFALDYLAGIIDADDLQECGGGWFLELNHARRAEIAARFNALPIAIEVDTPSGVVGIVHADCPFDSWDEMVAELCSDESFTFASVCLFSRERITANDARGVRNIDRVFVGHTPVMAPMSLGNVHYIDTGAVFRGALTVVRIN